MTFYFEALLPPRVELRILKQLITHVKYFLNFLSKMMIPDSAAQTHFLNR
jgi:hypothetical protein